MKRVLPAIALIAGLALTGCSGTTNQPQDDGDNAPAQPTEEAPQTTQLDQDQLKQIIESTDVDGSTFKYVDTAQASGNETIEALEAAEFEPAECKELAKAAFSAAEVSDGTMAAGMSSDNTLSASLMSFADDAGAEDQLKTTGNITDTCNDVTLKMQGMEMTMSYETFDAEVAGADESLGLTISIGVGGQDGFSSDSVTARVGNNIVTAASLAPEGDKEAPVKAAGAFLDAINNAA